MIFDLETLHTTFSSAEGAQITHNYTREEAEVMSGGLACRTMYPLDVHAFMRCQIGKLHTVKTKLGYFRSLGMVRFQTVDECIFELMAYGETWNQALSMLDVRTRE
jgi:hypothetical protein